MKTTQKTLAVYTPGLGVLSETFIFRHLTQLHPKTVAIFSTNRKPQAGNWDVSIPKYNASTKMHWLWERFRASRKESKYLRRFDPLCCFLKRHKVTVMMAQYMDQSLHMIDVCNTLGISLFIHAHGRDVSGCLKDPLMQEQYLRYRDLAGIITINQESKRALKELGLREERIHVISCGTEIPERSPGALRTKNEVQCTAVGRFTNIKAPILLLESFRRALLIQPNLRLNYIGGGELFAAAKQFVNVFDLSNQVELLGPQPPEVVSKTLSASDIFIQHSATDPVTGDKEGFPVSILEAMSHALPVISTRHAGIIEQVEEGISGELVDEGDVQSMAQHIASLANNQKQRERMGRAARERLEKNFTWRIERAKLRHLLGLEE